MMQGFRGVALVLVSLILVGCNNEKVRNLIDERTDQARQGIQEAQSPGPVKSYNPLVVTDKIWAGNTALRLRRGLPLPVKYEGSRGITLVAADPVSLSDIASTVSAQTGIPVRIAAGTSAPAAAPDPSNPSAATGETMALAYEGSMSGLLDQVAAHFGINWRFDGAAVTFSRFETRVFMVEALPGTQSTKDSVKEDQAGGGGGGSGGSSSSTTSALSQTSEMNLDFKNWDELSQTVTALLGGVGSVVAAPSSGTIVVTTTPDLMRVVAKFMEEENKRLSRQVAINIEIYKVDLAEGSNFSFTFDAVIKKLKIGSVTAGFGNIGSVDAAASATGAPGLSSGVNLPVAILNPNGLGTINSIFSALSSLGDTTRVAQFPLVTLNNRPVSRRVGRDKSFLQSTTTTTATSTTSGSISVTPGTIREGFSLQLTPRVLDDGRIMMQYSMSLVDIVSINPFGPTDNQIQLPETASRVFAQQSVLKSGSTLIIGGYDDEQTAQNAQGVGSPFNFLMGGGTSSGSTHAMLFIAITPQVLDAPRAEQE